MTKLHIKCLCHKNKPKPVNIPYKKQVTHLYSWMGGCWVSPEAVLTCLLQGLLCKTDQILHGFSLLVGCKFLNLCVCVIASPKWSLVVSTCVLCCRETCLLGWGNDHITACGVAFWPSWAASPCVCLTILLCLRYFAISSRFLTAFVAWRLHHTNFSALGIPGVV